MRTIVLTTGDVDGIGLEVAVKALRKTKPRAGERVILMRRRGRNEDRWVKSLRGWRVHRSSVFPTDFSASPQSNLWDLSLETSPVEWFEEAVSFCLKSRYAGVVTGPLSKKTIHESGRSDLGHTEILERMCDRKVVQGYLGTRFHVVLATAHVPLREVPRKLSAETLKRALDAATELRGLLTTAQAKRPIALLGLNPHAGEDGLIGDDEQAWKELLRTHAAKPQGPLVPDAAFRRENWSKHSVYVACYHDQGLIPFKMIHGAGAGAQISLGIPFVRTSVDHGTAKDLHGLNRADAGSMQDAFKWCRRLLAAQK